MPLSWAASLNRHICRAKSWRRPKLLASANPITATAPTSGLVWKAERRMNWSKCFRASSSCHSDAAREGHGWVRVDRSRIYPRISHKSVLAPNVIPPVGDDATVGIVEAGFNLIIDLLQTFPPSHAILDTGGSTSQCALIRFDVLSDVTSCQLRLTSVIYSQIEQLPTRLLQYTRYSKCSTQGQHLPNSFLLGPFGFESA